MEVLGLTVVEVAIALVAVFAGATLQGSLGFGLGLLAAPVLVLLDTRLVPGTIIAMGVPLTLMVAFRERHALDLGEVKWAIFGRIPGTLLGSVAVVVLAERWLAVLFGTAVLVAVLLSVVGWQLSPTRRTVTVAGFASGFMGTTTSIGGPPMALVYQRNTGPRLRASLGAFMAFGAAFSLVVLVAVGEFRGAELGLSLLLVPGVFAGFATSRWTNRFLDRGHTRTAVLVFAAASAVSILLRELL